MNGTFYFSAVRCVSALGLGIVSGMDHSDVAILVLLAAGAGHKVSVHKTYLIAREETEIFLRRLLHEVLSLDVKLFAEGNLTASKRLVLQIVRSGQVLNLSFRIVVDDQLYRMKDCHHTRSLGL